MIRKQRLCHDSFGISNVSTRGQPITSTLCKKVNNNNFNLKINFINLSKF